MSLYLVDSDLNRYDFLRADIDRGFPATVRSRHLDLAFGHGSKEIGDQRVDGRSVRVTTLLDGTTGGFVRRLFDCGDDNPVTDWASVVDDALAAAEDTTYVKQGSKSMKLGVDYDLHANDTAWWGYGGQSMDLSEYYDNWVYAWVYLPTLDYLKASGNCLFFYIGNDDSNRLEFKYTKADLSVGWNLLKMDLDNATSGIGTVTWTAIDYMWWGVAHLNTTDFDIYVDDIKLWREGYQAEYDDLMRQVVKQGVKFYKDANRYLNVQSMRLQSHKFIIGDAKATGAIDLFCPDPFWYDINQTTETAWTVTSSPVSNWYWNQGNIDVAPIIEITASADLSAGIELKNETDGNALFTYGDTNFTSGTKLTVDCLNGTVDLDGTTTIRFFEGRFLRLLADANKLTYTGGNCSIVLKHRDRWL